MWGSIIVSIIIELSKCIASKIKSWNFLFKLLISKISALKIFLLYGLYLRSYALQQLNVQLSYHQNDHCVHQFCIIHILSFLGESQYVMD